MKIALTGTTGFLGRHLLPAALGAGHAVAALVRPGRRLPASPGLTVREGDLGSVPALALLVEGAEAVVHHHGFRHGAAHGVHGAHGVQQRVLRALAGGVAGGASAIGLETSRAPVNAGAEATLAVRRPDTALAAAQELRTAGQGAVHVAALDLTDLDSVCRFAAKWRGQRPAAVGPGQRARGPAGLSASPPSPTAAAARRHRSNA